MDKTTQLEKTVKNRQKGPVLTSKGAFYSFFLWITHFFYSFNNSFNRTAKIFIQRIYSFKKDPKLSIQRIHSFKKDPKLFIQRIYSFKKIQNYSFKENIHSSEKCIIAQGYSCFLTNPDLGSQVHWTSTWDLLQRCTQGSSTRSVKIRIITMMAEIYRNSKGFINDMTFDNTSESRGSGQVGGNFWST